MFSVPLLNPADSGACDEKVFDFEVYPKLSRSV